MNHCFLRSFQFIVLFVLVCSSLSDARYFGSTESAAKQDTESKDMGFDDESEIAELVRKATKLSGSVRQDVLTLCKAIIATKYRLSPERQVHIEPKRARVISKYKLAGRQSGFGGDLFKRCKALIQNKYVIPRRN